LETPPLLDNPQPVWFRQPFGWIALAILLGIMLVGNLHDYLKRKTGPAGTNYMQQRLSLKMLVVLDESGDIATPTEVRQTDSIARSVMREVQNARKDDEEAEILFALASYEAEGRAPVDSIRHLAAARNPQLRVLADMYASDRLTPQQERNVEAQVTDSDFVFKMALGQARAKAGLPHPMDGVVSAGEAIGFLFGILLLSGAGLLGVGVIVFYIASRCCGKLKPAGHAAQDISPAEADTFAGMAALMLAAFLGVGSGLTKLAGNFTSRAPLLNCILGATAIILAILAWRVSPLKGRLGFKNLGAGKCLLWGVGAAVANLPIVLGVTILSMKLMPGLPIPEHPIQGMLNGPRSLWVVVSLLFLVSVEAPIFEETLFRGLIQPALAMELKQPWLIWMIQTLFPNSQQSHPNLRQKWAAFVKQPWLAGIISSLLFASIHPTGIPAWPALAMIGGMSVFLTYQTKSIVPSMIMHSIHNALMLTISLLLT
jgi:membrane protease YdiL (CAAX protease family)